MLDLPIPLLLSDIKLQFDEKPLMFRPKMGMAEGGNRELGKTAAPVG